MSWSAETASRIKSKLPVCFCISLALREITTSSAPRRKGINSHPHSRRTPLARPVARLLETVIEALTTLVRHRVRVHRNVGCVKVRRGGDLKLAMGRFSETSRLDERPREMTQML